MSEPTLGERLKAERERRGLSTQKAADDLHLDAWVIEALEAGDYARIGPAVYAKGYLRKYASTLGVAVGELSIGGEPRLTVPAVGAASPGLRVQNASEAAATARLGLLGPLLALSIVALISGLVWWHPWRLHSLERPAAGASSSSASAGAAAGAASLAASAAAAPGVASGAPGAEGLATASSGAHATPAASLGDSGMSAAGATGTGATLAAGAGAAAGIGRTGDAGTAAAGAAAPATQAPALTGTSTSAPRGAGHARLKLSFSADSWVEVHDSTGRRVFAGQGRANSVKTIAGLAPLEVYLGYASGVQLEVNDRAVAIGRQFMSGDVARFEAGADGTLRRAPGGGAGPHAAHD